jgi:SNF2 family DNA or RNA helicase
MADFVNPGILGDLSTFKRVYLTAIDAGSEKDCKPELRQLAKQRLRELGRITEQFVLRRTSEAISKFLPPKTE